MLRAFVSDVHGNLVALRAVVADIRQRGIKEVYSLGDVVGYGPEPCACIDLISEVCELNILGNHDNATLWDPFEFNDVAEKAIFWTRDEMERKSRGGKDYFDFVNLSPPTHTLAGARLVHGSPRSPTNEYLRPEDIYDRKNVLDKNWARFDTLAFCGHTHVPGVFGFDGTSYSFLEASDLSGEAYQLTASRKHIVNVGSVGQPRDGDPRACYLLWDDTSGSIEYVRVEYDVDATIQKIAAIPALHDRLGQRLRTGN